MPKAVLLPVNSSMLWNVPDLLPQPVPATPYSIPCRESGCFQQKSFPRHDSAVTTPQRRLTSTDTGYYCTPDSLAVLNCSQAHLNYQVNVDLHYLKLHMKYM